MAILVNWARWWLTLELNGGKGTPSARYDKPDKPIAREDMASLPLWEEPDLTKMHAGFVQTDVSLLACNVLSTIYNFKQISTSQKRISLYIKYIIIAI